MCAFPAFTCQYVCYAKGLYGCVQNVVGFCSSLFTVWLLMQTFFFFFIYLDVFPDLSKYFVEYNVIIANRTNDQSCDKTLFSFVNKIVLLLHKWFGFNIHTYQSTIFYTKRGGGLANQLRNGFTSLSQPLLNMLNSVDKTIKKTARASLFPDIRLRLDSLVPDLWFTAHMLFPLIAFDSWIKKGDVTSH